MRRGVLFSTFVLAGIVWMVSGFLVAAQTDNEAVTSGLLTSRVIDAQSVPIAEAEVTIKMNVDDSSALARAMTQADGRFVLTLPNTNVEKLYLEIERRHYQSRDLELRPGVIELLENGQPVVLDDIRLERRISAAFWAATLVFVGVLGLLASRRLNNTLAAMSGAITLFAISYLGRPLSEDLVIFEFERGLEYVDWEVIFLIVGMMVVIAVIERTGVFQWLAYTAFRISGGRMWLLLPILMVIAGVTSAFLDNVTTMLLMTPITVQIALALEGNPLTLLVPQVMASNVAGISTLIGEPPNILIGSYAGISFADFLVNQTPGVILAMIGLIIYSEWSYRRELKTIDGGSPRLMEKLAEHAKITQPDNLKKAGIVGAAMLVMFIFGEVIQLVPAVTAMLGAIALMLWVRPNVEDTIEAVDWTTIAFFISLFLIVGGLQEVGMISMIAQAVGNFVGDNLVLTMFAVVWSGAVFSAIIDNIPFTTAMLPVVGFLTATIPNANSKVLFYCLSVGAAMGGNGSLIGSSANLVTAGIAERAGYPITYGYFLRKGAPSVLITIIPALLWLLLRFVVLA